MCCLSETTSCLIKRFKTFNIWDIGVFKTCMVVFGILIGMYSNKSCKKIAPLIWITFIFSYVYVIYRLFSDEKNK